MATRCAPTTTRETCACESLATNRDIVDGDDLRCTMRRVQHARDVQRVDRDAIGESRPRRSTTTTSIRKTFSNSDVDLFGIIDSAGVTPVC